MLDARAVASAAAAARRSSDGNTRPAQPSALQSHPPNGPSLARNQHSSNPDRRQWPPTDNTTRRAGPPPGRWDRDRERRFPDRERDNGWGNRAGRPLQPQIPSQKSTRDAAAQMPGGQWQQSPPTGPAAYLKHDGHAPPRYAVNGSLGRPRALSATDETSFEVDNRSSLNNGTAGAHSAVDPASRRSASPLRTHAASAEHVQEGLSLSRTNGHVHGQGALNGQLISGVQAKAHVTNGYDAGLASTNHPSDVHPASTRPAILSSQTALLASYPATQVLGKRLREPTSTQTRPTLANGPNSGDQRASPPHAGNARQETAVSPNHSRSPQKLRRLASPARSDGGKSNASAVSLVERIASGATGPLRSSSDSPSIPLKVKTPSLPSSPEEGAISSSPQRDPIASATVESLFQRMQNGSPTASARPQISPPAARIVTYAEAASDTTKRSPLSPHEVRARTSEHGIVAVAASPRAPDAFAAQNGHGLPGKSSTPQKLSLLDRISLPDSSPSHTRDAGMSNPLRNSPSPSNPLRTSISIRGAQLNKLNAASQLSATPDDIAARRPVQASARPGSPTPLQLSTAGVPSDIERIAHLERREDTPPRGSPPPEPEEGELLSDEDVMLEDQSATVAQRSSDADVPAAPNADTAPTQHGSPPPVDHAETVEDIPDAQPLTVQVTAEPIAEENPKLPDTEVQAAEAELSGMSESDNADQTSLDMTGATSLSLLDDDLLSAIELAADAATAATEKSRHVGEPQTTDAAVEGIQMSLDESMYVDAAPVVEVEATAARVETEDLVTVRRPASTGDSEMQGDDGDKNPFFEDFASKQAARGPEQARSVDSAETDEVDSEFAMLLDDIMDNADTTPGSSVDQTIDDILWQNRLRAPVTLPIRVKRSTLKPNEMLDKISSIENEVLASAIRATLEDRDARRGRKIVRLRQQYKDYNSEWQVHLRRLERIQERQHRTGVGIVIAPMAASGDAAASAYMSSLSMPSMLSAGGRSSRRGPAALGVGFSQGDAVRSEAEMEAIIAQITESEMNDPNLRAARTVVNEPDMALHADELPSHCAYQDQNGLVTDPMEFYEIHKVPEVWTEEETATFVRRFVLFPKNFGKIAASLPNRSVRQCVQFYYRMKKTLNLKSLLDNRNRDGKRKKARRSDVPSLLPQGKGGSLLSGLQPVEEDEVVEDEDMVSQTPGSAGLDSADYLKQADTAMRTAGAATLSALSQVASADPADFANNDSYIDDETAETLGASGAATKSVKGKQRRLSISDSGQIASPTLSMDIAGARTASTSRRSKTNSSSYWSAADKSEYQRLLKIHGKDWEAIAKRITSKTAVQCKNFFQNNNIRYNLAQLAASAGDGQVMASETMDANMQDGGVDGVQQPAAGFFLSEQAERSQPVPAKAAVAGKGGMNLMNLLNDAPDAEGGAHREAFSRKRTHRDDESSATEEEAEPGRYVASTHFTQPRSATLPPMHHRGQREETVTHLSVAAGFESHAQHRLPPMTARGPGYVAHQAGVSDNMPLYSSQLSGTTLPTARGRFAPVARPPWSGAYEDRNGRNVYNASPPIDRGFFINSNGRAASVDEMLAAPSASQMYSAPSVPSRAQMYAQSPFYDSPGYPSSAESAYADRARIARQQHSMSPVARTGFPQYDFGSRH